MIRQPTIPKIQTPQIRISAFRFHIENGKLVCTMYKDLSVQEKNAFWKSFVDTVHIREDGSIADIIFLCQISVFLQTRKTHNMF